MLRIQTPAGRTDGTDTHKGADPADDAHPNTSRTDSSGRRCAPKDRVLHVEVGRRAQQDGERGATGPGVIPACHAQDPPPVVLQVGAHLQWHQLLCDSLHIDQTAGAVLTCTPLKTIRNNNRKQLAEENKRSSFGSHTWNAYPSAVPIALLRDASGCGVLSLFITGVKTLCMLPNKDGMSYSACNCILSFQWCLDQLTTQFQFPHLP
jgi:hypothetical protein